MEKCTKLYIKICEFTLYKSYTSTKKFFKNLTKNKSQSFQKEKAGQHTEQRLFQGEYYIVSTFSSDGKIIISSEYT